ncbi:MAG: hypothetical protein AAGB22_04840, partial [Bacteroidota bacterium]
MRSVAFIAIFLCSSLLAKAQVSSFEERSTSASNVSMAVTNVGTIGNAFRGYRDASGTPSCEFPVGSGIDHLFEGGIWVGGLVAGNQVLVSTSALDAPQGFATGRGGFEFTGEVGSTLVERSSLFDSPFFSPQAVSHQDFVAEFSDRNIIVPGTSIPIQSHTVPMNLDVRFSTFNWNFTFSDFFVIVNLDITNGGTDRIDSMYVALWTNTVVRNVNVTPAGSGGSAFFNKGGNGYMDSLHMAYGFDATGDPDFTRSYIGQRFLGAEDKEGFHHPDIDPRFDSHYNAWTFNSATDPVFFAATNDAGRYQKMTTGLNDNACWTQDVSQNPNCPGQNYQETLNAAGNRSDLLSVGPFRAVEPGETVSVAFAIVLAKKKEDGLPNTANTPEQRTNLIVNSSWAQTAFNGEDSNFNGLLDDGEDNDGDGEITRFILPSPPNSPRTRIVAEGNKVDIYWSDNAEFSVDPITQERDFEGYRLYMTKLGFDVTKVPNLQEDLIQIAEYDIPGNGLFNEIGFESVRMAQPVFFEGDTNVYRYKFTIDNLLNGWQYAIAVTAFDRGNPESNLEPLETSVLANDFRVFPGTGPNDDMDANEPYAYPNPYYAGAAWEGLTGSIEANRKLVFANLPRRCVIRVFSPAGDLIDEIDHNDSNQGDDIRWYQSFGESQSDNNVFSGGEHAWDLLTADTQILARGLYLFSV